MKIKSIVLPSLALGAAALLVIPGSDSKAFSVIGGSLSLGQRDVRIFNNFSDPASNNNTTPDPQFPGGLGAELAIWKGAVEWGSIAHGDGSGDPTQAVIGSGGANFDITWSGVAAGVGGTNHNIVSATSNCGAGVIAFTQTPISDGWTIRFCDGNFNFGDGPGLIPGSQFDIQGIMAHEYGHALGLGHSIVGGSTMFASGSSGSESERSIAPDDASGVQFVYGVMAASKPTITSIDVSGGGTQMTIHGNNFSPTGIRIWFTNASITATNVDPRQQTPLLNSSNGGTQIDLAIPANAREGDVLVRNAGLGSVFSNLSNAFPSDLTDTTGGGTNVSLASVSPSTVDALVPGTAQFMTVTGAGFLGLTGIVLEPGITVPASSFTIVNDNTVTIDLPQANALGAATLTFSDAGGSADIGFNIVAPASVQLQLEDGDNTSTVTTGGILDVIMAGIPGTVHRIAYSTSNIPSSTGMVCFLLGNNFSNFNLGPQRTIPASGYVTIGVDIQLTGALEVFYVQTSDNTTAPAPKQLVSNLQSVSLGS